MAAARVRARAAHRSGRQGQPRRGWIDPRQPWAVHVGRHAARVLPEQHPHHRSDGRVHRRASRRQAAVFGGLAHKPLDGRRDIAAQILPALRGTVSSNRRVIAHFTDTDEALTFAGSRWASALSRLGTSCPDHFLRTRICPFFVDWDPAAGTVDSAEGRHSHAGGRLPTRVPALLRLVRDTGFAEAARLESVGRHHSWHRAVRLRQKQERSADYHGVLPERHQRDGRRHGAGNPDRHDGSPAPGSPGGADRSVRTTPQLRRAAALGSVRHRVLGARRSEAAADARRSGVQPQDCAGRRRRQRHRPRGGAAPRAQRRARRRGRRRRGQRDARCRGSGGDLVGRICRGHASRSELRGQSRAAPPRSPSFISAASTASSIPPRFIRSPTHPAVSPTASGQRRSW